MVRDSSSELALQPSSDTLFGVQIISFDDPGVCSVAGPKVNNNEIVGFSRISRRQETPRYPGVVATDGRTLSKDHTQCTRITAVSHMVTEAPRIYALSLSLFRIVPEMTVDILTHLRNLEREISHQYGCILVDIFR